jgi:hypothetical protein
MVPHSLCVVHWSIQVIAISGLVVWNGRHSWTVCRVVARKRTFERNVFIEVSTGFKRLITDKDDFVEKNHSPVICYEFHLFLIRTKERFCLGF